MKEILQNVNKKFAVIYMQAERMASKFGVTPSIPRTVSRQAHRNNVPALTPEEYFRRVLAVPPLNTFISEMEFRFNKFSTMVSRLLYLVPEVLCRGDAYTLIHLINATLY